MTTEKNSITFFKDQNGLILNVLSDEEAGKIFKAILKYGTDGERTDFGEDKLLAEIFRVYAEQIDRVDAKYLKKKGIAHDNGVKGGRPKKNQTETKENLKKPKETNGFSSVSNENQQETLPVPVPVPVPAPVPVPVPAPVPAPAPVPDRVNNGFDCLQEFERFWNAYPVHEGRDRTAREFVKLIQEGWETVQLIQAAEHYAECCKRKGTAKDFQIRGWNFLNRKCFVDYIELPESEGDDAEGPTFAIRDNFYG